jgi:hypothetical protein
MASESGYNLLLRDAFSLIGTQILDSDAAPTDEDLVFLLRNNRAALEMARRALGQPCGVALEYSADFFEKHSQDWPRLRDLARSFRLELNWVARSGNPSQAVDIGVEILDLANAIRRGGLIVYSPGPGRQDHGGRFGSWAAVQAGQADLCLDVFDYQDAGCGWSPDAGDNGVGS